MNSEEAFVQGFLDGACKTAEIDSSDMDKQAQASALDDMLRPLGQNILKGMDQANLIGEGAPATIRGAVEGLSENVGQAGLERTLGAAPIALGGEVLRRGIPQLMESTGKRTFKNMAQDFASSPAGMAAIGGTGVLGGAALS